MHYLVLAITLDLVYYASVWYTQTYFICAACACMFMSVVLQLFHLGDHLIDSAVYTTHLQLCCPPYAHLDFQKGLPNFHSSACLAFAAASAIVPS